MALIGICIYFALRSLVWAAEQIEKLHTEFSNAVPVGWLSYNLHVLAHLRESLNGHPAYEMELWIELGNQALKAIISGRCRRDVEIFLTKHLLAERAIARLSRRPELAAVRIVRSAKQPASQRVSSGSNMTDGVARTIHDISLLYCEGLWSFGAAATGDAAVSCAFGRWLGEQPGMSDVAPAAAAVNAFSGAYIHGHTYHALAYTRKSSSISEAVSWQAEVLLENGKTRVAAVQRFLYVTHPAVPGVVYRAAVVFLYTEHALVGADDKAVAATAGLPPRVGAWLKAGLRVVWALPVSRNGAGEPQLGKGAAQGDYEVAVVSAARLIRRRLVPRVKEAAWMPAQWCNCHPVLP